MKKSDKYIIIINFKYTQRFSINRQEITCARIHDFIRFPEALLLLFRRYTHISLFNSNRIFSLLFLSFWRFLSFFSNCPNRVHTERSKKQSWDAKLLSLFSFLYSYCGSSAMQKKLNTVDSSTLFPFSLNKKNYIWKKRGEPSMIKKQGKSLRSI